MSDVLADASVLATDASAFLGSNVPTKAPTYEVADDTPRGIVKRNSKGEPTTVVVIGKHAKGEHLALVQVAGDVQTGIRLETVGAAIRDGVISPAAIKQLQEIGGVYDPELHAPESEEDESADEQE